MMVRDWGHTVLHGGWNCRTPPCIPYAPSCSFHPAAKLAPGATPFEAGAGNNLAEMGARECFEEQHGAEGVGQQGHGYGNARLSLCQGLDDVLHQHGANDHLLTVDGQLSRGALPPLQSDEHQAPTCHCLGREPVGW